MLPPEFNLRFWMAGYYNQPVRILHGWGDAETYRKVAALLNEPATSRRYRGVFIGRALLDKRGEVVGRFPKGPARFRPERVKRSTSTAEVTASAGLDRQPE